jgi:hypothetical protein
MHVHMLPTHNMLAEIVRLDLPFVSLLWMHAYEHCVFSDCLKERLH